MTILTVKYDLTPSMVEGEIRDKLIEMGWTPPKPKKKIIDLSMMVGSDIDMEFKLNSTEWKIGKLSFINKDSTEGIFYHALNFHGSNKCRIRQDHWHVWQGGKCPLPDGLRIKIMLRNGRIPNSTTYATEEWTWEHHEEDGDIIAFKVDDIADEYICEHDWDNE